ncbi:MAG: hypothetical protein HKN09_07460 [Saprospiraceae bacterium]|nr:hypothetical protein [Saprospiraceae bacterium]
MAALIFARFGSSRLPGKALQELGHQALLQWSINAAKRLENCGVILATSDSQQDDPLAELASVSGIEIYRGSLENVALRTLQCIEEFELDYFFRINGDSPFLNLPLLEASIQLLASHPDCDMVSNLINRSYPYGVSCELIKASSFVEAYPKMKDSELEHITQYFYRNKSQFNIVELPILEADLSHYRMTIDTEEDLELIRDFVESKSDLDFNKLDINDLINEFDNYNLN